MTSISRPISNWTIHGLQRQQKALLDNLPIKAKINKWGDELYTERTCSAANQENAESILKPSDVAYWPQGSAICLFLGPTPISKSTAEILPYSPVNFVVKIVSEAPSPDQIKDDSTLIIESE